MDETKDPGPLNFAPVGPAADPGKQIAEPAADPVPGPVPTPPPAPAWQPPPASTPPPPSWSVREPATPPRDPMVGLLSLPVTPPPPPPTAPPFLEVRPDGSLAEPKATVSSRTAIAVVLTTLLIAVAGIVGIAMRPSAARPVASSATTPASIAEPVATPAPTVGFDRTAAGQKYLSAVGPASQAQTTMNNMINTDMTKPCTCPAGHFNASDALAYLPTFNSLMSQSISELNALAATLPSIPRADVTAVAVSLQDLQTQWGTFFSNAGASQTLPDQLNADSVRITGLSAKVRSDLGLPPR